MQPIQSADSIMKSPEQKEGEFSKEDSVTNSTQRKFENEVNKYFS